VIRVALAVLARPRLWPTGVRQVRRLARPGWYRRAPFLPLPPRTYLAFRSTTQSGDPDAPLDPAEAVSYLEWCRSWDRGAPRAATR
jgi:hypothetical protein